MKKAKLIIKWSMLGVPCIIFGVNFTLATFNQNADAFALGAASLHFSILWLILSLIVLALLKYLLKRQVKHETNKN